MRDFRRVAEWRKWLKGMPKGSVAVDVILQNPSLPHNLRSGSIKLAAANAKNRFSMSETSVGSFGSHGRQQDYFPVLLTLAIV